MNNSRRRPGSQVERAGRAPDALPEQVAELVGEVAEAPTPSWRRRLTREFSRLAGRSGRTGWRGMRSGGRWLTAEVLAMAPRLPVRDQQRLREQFPGLGPEELAEALIHGAGRAAAVVGAGAGAAMVLPLPSAPVEIAVETLALVGIEIKLAYVAAWAHRRGVALAPAGLVVAAGSPLRRLLRRRLIARAARGAISLGPLLTGAIAGAALNRIETRHLGDDVRDDLRRRSPYAANWAR